jgi:hypothetical protein
VTILEHCDNEYFIIMHPGTNLDSLEPGLNKLADKEIITDWEDTEFEQKLSAMSESFDNPGLQIHIYIPVKNDKSENWETIANTLGMKLSDFHQAKKLMTRVYRAYFEFEWDDDYKPEYETEKQEALDDIERVKARGLTLIPKDSLWRKPLPGAKKIKDYDGRMIKLSRLSQFEEDTPDFLNFEWGEDVLLFHLVPDDGHVLNRIDILQEIEKLLLQTKEA